MVEIEFRTRKLRRCFEREAEAIQEWGPQVGRRYIGRLQAIMAAPAVADLRALRALDFHALRQNRRGQYAIRLTGQMRLILEPGADERTLVVVEVTDYHD